jgi:hypothetical protein
MSLATNPGYVPTETAVQKGGNFLVELSFADIVAAVTGAGATVVNLFNYLGNAQGVELEHMELITPFVSSDGTLISSAITVGDVGSAARLLASTELNAAGAYVNLAYGTGTKYAPAANTEATATITPTGGKNLNTLTAGKVALFFKIRSAQQVLGPN